MVRKKEFLRYDAGREKRSHGKVAEKETVGFVAQYALGSAVFSLE